MSTFFTSDHHFFHRNIIKYSNRPFSSVEEMHETLIDNHNSVVSKHDNVYFIGDFCFESNPNKINPIFERLNGHKFLVLGNHDNVSTMKKLKWVWIRDRKEIKVGKQNITLEHYAMKVWNKSHRGAWQLYGHSHGMLPDDIHSLQMDVGVDCHNYTPISFEQVEEHMSKKIYKGLDGHGERK